MRYCKNKVTALKIAYIGGGSRGWAWGLMSDLASEPALCGTVRLYDIDRQAAQNNEQIGNSFAGAEGAKSAWRYKAVDSLKQALTGADFVVISILPGTFDEMESDVHAPEQYGIYQPVGDSTGPGGILRAFRAIPMFVEIGEAIRKYAPQAWVINYTNPMTMLVRTLYRVFPQIRAFGCCHEVFGTQVLLGMAYSAVTEDDFPSERSDIKVNVQGINHFTWINQASYKGVDLLPVFDAYIDMMRQEQAAETDPKEKHNLAQHFVKYDLFKRYGVIAAAGDRHLVEFLPPWYVKTPEVAYDWGFALTSVASRKQGLAKRLEKSARLLSGEDKPRLKQTGEDGVRQIKALLGLGDLITNVNLPNRGQIPNLPLDAVVETNAVFTRGSVKPVFAGEMQKDVCSLVSRVVNCQETTVQAVLTKDKELGFRAFLQDPQMCIPLLDARVLYEQMIANTKRYLHWL